MTTAILARLLTPSDFGLLSMMIVVTGLVGFLADAGISNAIIHRQDATREELSTLYWLSFIAGAAIFIIVLLSCPLAVIYFKEPQLSTYLPVLGINFLILPIGQQFAVLLRKELRFKTLTKIEVTAISAASGVAIVVAVFGFGVWSLVFRPIVATTVQAIALLAFARQHHWLPGFHFSLKRVRSYVGFGLFQMGERLVNYFSSNVDYIIIGRFLGTEALGLYSLAYGLITVPLNKINPVVTNVAFPTFARIQYDNVRLQAGYLKILRYISTCTFPILAGMFVVAPLFVPIVYGSNWAPAVPVLQILCLIGILYSLGNPIGSLLLAKGRADLGFYFNLFKVMIMAAANFIGVRWGIIGVAWSSLAAIAIVMWPLEFYLRWHVIRMKVSDYLQSFKIPAMVSGFMLILLLSMKFVWNEMSNVSSLVSQIVAGGVFYCLVTWIIARRFCRELISSFFVRPREEP